LNLELNNDNELIKHFDKNFAIFLLENKFPFSKKFKEMHNYNYINDSKYSTICLDEIKCGQKSKDKSKEVKFFPINIINLRFMKEFIGKKRNLNEKNFLEVNLNFNLSEKKTNNSSNKDNINIDNILQNDNFDINFDNNFGQESFLSDEEKIFFDYERMFKEIFK